MVEKYKTWKENLSKPIQWLIESIINTFLVICVFNAVYWVLVFLKYIGIAQ